MNNVSSWKGMSKVCLPNVVKKKKYVQSLKHTTGYNSAILHKSSSCYISVYIMSKQALNEFTCLYVTSIPTYLNNWIQDLQRNTHCY